MLSIVLSFKQSLSPVNFAENFSSYELHNKKFFNLFSTSTYVSLYSLLNPAKIQGLTHELAYAIATAILVMIDGVHVGHQMEIRSMTIMGVVNTMVKPTTAMVTLVALISRWYLALVRPGGSKDGCAVPWLNEFCVDSSDLK
jgi:hypothetical protein